MSMRSSSCLPIVALMLVLAGCGGTDVAKRGVEEFRARAAQRSYGEIYRTAAPELQQATTEVQFEEFMRALDRKLGAWQSAGEPIWNVTRGTDGHLVRLTYQSQFANGAASELFLWRIADGAPTLLGYHVNSPLLVTR